MDVAGIRDAYACEVISEGEVCIVAAAGDSRDSCMREERGGWMEWNGTRWSEEKGERAMLPLLYALHCLELR